jgi:molybdate transport system substrate-binding protein
MAMFARNALCVLVPAGTNVLSGGLLDHLLNPAIDIGISPARIDPLGDYTELLFRRAEMLRPGTEASLRSRAVVLDTPPGSPPPRSGDVTTDALQDGRIGAAIVYCSGRARYAGLMPGAAMLAFPAPLEVGPEYGLAVVSTRSESMSLALALLSPDGQRALASWGFIPVTLPTP